MVVKQNALLFIDLDFMMKVSTFVRITLNVYWYTMKHWYVLLHEHVNYVTN